MPFILAGSSLRVGLVAGDSLLITADSPAAVTFVIGGAAIPGINKPGMDSRALYYGPLLTAAEIIIAAVVSTDFETVRGLYAQVETGLVVTLTAAEIGAPQPGILADTSATYKLNLAPFTRYRSDGAALVSLGSGGGGATNLSFTRDADSVSINSDTGTDADVPAFTAALAGMVPASGGGTTNFLRADGTFAAPPGAGAATFAAITGAPTDNTALNAELRINASVLTANAMGAGTVINTASALNTKTISADTALTYSGTPPVANTAFVLRLANGGTDRTITIPSSRSLTQQALITSFVLPANAVVPIYIEWDGTQYLLSGEPVRQTFQFSWSFIGTTTARDYSVITKNQRPFVLTNLVSKCTSGTATATGKIDGVALGGTANAVSAAEVDQAHATANTAVAGTDFAIGFTAGAVDPVITGYGYYL